MAGNRSSRACVSARSKLHLFRTETCYLELLLVLRRGMTQVVETQTVKDLRIGIEFGVKIDRVCRRKDRGALGNFRSIRKSDGFPRQSMESDCYSRLRNRRLYTGNGEVVGLRVK